MDGDRGGELEFTRYEPGTKKREGEDEVDCRRGRGMKRRCNNG